MFCIQHYNLFHHKVFLDELNTSSYMGLFKEMMVDKSFEGEVQTWIILITWLFVTISIASSIKYISDRCL